MAKSKYIMHLCAYCHKDTKMELVGEMHSEGANAAPGKVWYRCTRCKHSALLERIVPLDKNFSAAKLDRNAATEYAQNKVFKVGQMIYHSEWDDVGRVVAKIKTSSGVQAITVAFEKLGERKLIENVGLESLQSAPTQA